MIVGFMIAATLLPNGAGNAVIAEGSGDIPDTVLLDEKFNSWSELDTRWTFWNRTTGDFRNWFNVTDGQLHATNNGILELETYLSYANWTQNIVYDGELRISFDIYLPMAYNDKIGWAGQVFYVQLFDQSGNYGLISRFVMDYSGDNPSPNGFVYWDEAGVIEQICTFDAGWHHVSYVMRSNTITWSAQFDGIVYDNLQYSSPQTGPFDISKLTLVNALREEVQNIYIDNLLVEAFDGPEDQNGNEATDAMSWLESEWLPLGAVVILAIVLVSILLLGRVKGSNQYPPP